MRKLTLKEKRAQRRMSCQLRELRKQKGLSVLDLSEQLAISETAIWEWESSKHRVPDALVMLDLCNILECSVEDVYPLKGRKKQKLKRERK
jgi:transcriptional regulator with XRE-family HTH domain